MVTKILVNRITNFLFGLLLVVLGAYLFSLEYFIRTEAGSLEKAVIYPGSMLQCMLGLWKCASALLQPQSNVSGD